MPHDGRHAQSTVDCMIMVAAGGVPRDQPLAAVGELMEPVEAVLLLAAEQQQLVLHLEGGVGAARPGH
eukprot:COSAG04_NODE_733_length_10713_cov_8.864236_2_plen_68_part_00